MTHPTPSDEISHPAARVFRAGRHTGRSRITVQRIREVPRRRDIIDVAATFALAALAFAGLGNVFSGTQYFIVAMAGVALGGCLAYVAHLLRQPVIVLIAAAAITFFALGGAFALRNTPGVGSLPSAATVSRLARQAVFGWKDLLTTLPPVDGSGPLLVLPYLLGLFTGLGAIALATRTRNAFAPLAVSVLTMATVILLGNETPTLLTVRAASFAVVALGWVCARAGRTRPATQSGNGQLVRWATGIAMLALAGVGAAMLGPHLPGVGSHQRVVLRSYVDPPSNLGNYPSPLAEFRRYRACNSDGQGMAPATPLFTINGTVPDGTAMHFAALDTYNGTVWQVSNEPRDGAAKPDSFLKVGTVLENPAPGPRATLKIAVPGSFRSGYHDYWLPIAGTLQGITFAGPDAVADTRDFRYNLATGTGVVPGSVNAGDSYTIRVAATVPARLTPTAILSASATLPDVAGGSLDFLQSSAAALSANNASPAQQILAIGSALRRIGKDADCQRQYQYYLAGESLGRLSDYARGLGDTNSGLYVGDNEQSAAFYALMIEQLGVPARVVVGVADLHSGVHTITSRDVTAWVEVQASNGSWLTIPASEFNPTDPPDKKEQLQRQPQNATKPIPPPAQGRPKTPLDDSSLAGASAARGKKAERPGSHQSWLPSWVAAALMWGGPSVLLICAVCGLIVGLKRVRRYRRRTSGSTTERLAHGWRELVDQARDLGAVVTARCTRLEQANTLGKFVESADHLARRADASIFGPAAPTDADAIAYWAEINAARSQAKSTLGLMQRVRAALSLASLRTLRVDAGSPPLRAATVAGTPSE